MNGLGENFLDKSPFSDNSFTSAEFRRVDGTFDESVLVDWLLAKFELLVLKVLGAPFILEPAPLPFTESFLFIPALSDSLSLIELCLADSCKDFDSSADFDATEVPG